MQRGRHISALRLIVILAIRFAAACTVIALDIENSIPACAIILERDLRAQLHQLFFRKLLSQTHIQIVRDIRGRISHRVSQLDDKAFRVIEWGSVVAEHSAQFVIAQACFSAHGRIDIYSERTTNPGRGADFSKLDITQGDKSFAASPASMHPAQTSPGKRIWIFAGVKSFPNILRITP